jgi:hypothetical protein
METTNDLELASGLLLPPDNSTLPAPATGPGLAPNPVLLPAEPFAREAAWIRAQHKQLSRDHLVIIARSIVIGEQLERVKAALDAERYGQWGGWLKRNLLGISERHLRRYREIFRRRDEPIVREDPRAFLAQVYGNIATDAPLDSITSDVTSEVGGNGAKPPSKKKGRKAKDAPPPAAGSDVTSKGSDAPAPKPLSVGKLSLERLLGNAAEALEEWRETYWEPLMEKTVSAELDAIGEDVDALVERMNECARSLSS